MHELRNIPIPINKETLFLKPTMESEVMKTIRNLKNMSGDTSHSFTIKLATSFK